MQVGSRKQPDCTVIDDEKTNEKYSKIKVPKKMFPRKQLQEATRLEKIEDKIEDQVV